MQRDEAKELVRAEKGVQRTYRVEMCDGPSTETVEITAASDEDAVRQAAEATREWIRGGDWGEDGAEISAHWRLLNPETEDEDGEMEEIDEGNVTVEIEPDHSVLITRACGGRHDDRYDRCCGTDAEDHDWTSEGEGGCDSNPGVWSTGGTSMMFQDHCRVCGLSRTERTTGTQKNPGEHDTVEYAMPERWCSECEGEECHCEHNEEDDD